MFDIVSANTLLVIFKLEPLIRVFIRLSDEIEQKGKIVEKSFRRWNLAENTHCRGRGSPVLLAMICYLYVVKQKNPNSVVQSSRHSGSDKQIFGFRCDQSTN